MARKGENIYKRKDGRWEGRYKNGYKSDGKPRYTSVYGKSYREVRRVLIEKKSHSVSGAVICKLTVQKLFELYLSEIKFKVKESTYSNYYMKIHNHILPFFAGIKYEALTVEFLNSFTEKKLSDGLSAKYVYDIIVLIKAVSKFAHKRYNYADKAEFMAVPRRERTVKAINFNESDRDILLKKLVEENTTSAMGIYLAAITGLRLGELCALKWSDIDLEKRIITVNHTMQRIKSFDGSSKTKIIISSPKSITSKREIPIPLSAVSVAEKFSRNGDCYVITGTAKFAEPRTLQYRFKALLKKYRLPYINFHTLRHCFATKCSAVGFDVKTLSEILGHSTVELTLNRYVHSSVERKQRFMDMLV